MLMRSSVWFESYEFVARGDPERARYEREVEVYTSHGSVAGSGAGRREASQSECQPSRARRKAIHIQRCCKDSLEGPELEDKSQHRQVTVIGVRSSGNM
jgi:hypothetical protein